MYFYGLVLSLSIAIFMQTSANSQQVLVQPSSNVHAQGQGVLRFGPQNDCFVVLPSHVVKSKKIADNSFSNKGTITDFNGRVFPVLLQKVIRGNFPSGAAVDLAILRVESYENLCFERWRITPELHLQLRLIQNFNHQKNLVRLRVLRANGTLFYKDLKVISRDAESLLVETTDAMFPLMRGDSGGQVYIGARWGGMLLNVEKRKGKVVGHVLLQNFVWRAISHFFRDSDNYFGPNRDNYRQNQRYNPPGPIIRLK